MILLTLQKHLKNTFVMSLQRKNFYRYLAQTSPAPLALEIQSAEGVYIIDTRGKHYIDLISGISVSSTGHRHPEVLAAISKQLERHLHIMVYGEFIQEPQVKLATLIAELLPPSLNTTYFVNSGSEAVEGALKLAKRYTGRHEIIAFKKAYHGSTHGALSVTEDESLKMRYRPLLPSVKHLEFNNTDELEYITSQTACVIIEPVQGEAGIFPAHPEFLKALRQKCCDTGSLLIFDEIQTGMGRTGSMFAFEKYGLNPDILLLAKAFGGGLPLGAFIASGEIMECLSHDPVLGHISTFGGHPLSCAAALANLQVIIREKLVDNVEEKAGIFINGLKDLEAIKEIRNAGLMMALQFEDEKFNHRIIGSCLQKGLITDWFLFKADALRIAPPLTISKEEIGKALGIIREAILEIGKKG
jgi:acetylornithine/succinyldiaminopimelate/putrescine aminotransferase